MGRTNKKACEEESGSAVETSQIQDLETNICDMTAESLHSLLFSRSRFNSKKGVKKKGTKRLHFWSKIHSGIAYSI